MRSDKCYRNKNRKIKRISNHSYLIKVKIRVSVILSGHCYWTGEIIIIILKLYYGERKREAF